MGKYVPNLHFQHQRALLPDPLTRGPALDPTGGFFPRPRYRLGGFLTPSLFTMKFTPMGACSASLDHIAGLWGLKGKKGREEMLGLSPILGYASDLGYSSSTSHLCNAISLMDTDSYH